MISNQGGTSVSVSNRGLECSTNRGSFNGVKTGVRAPIVQIAREGMRQQKPLLKVAFVVFWFGATLSGCGIKSKQSQWRQHAPTEHHDVGTVLRAQSIEQAQEIKNEIESLMESNPSVEAREISLGMYEVFNASESELAQVLSNHELKAFKNIYFKNLVPNEHELRAQQAKAELVDLAKCKEDVKLSPIGLIEPTALQTKIKNRLIEITDGAVSFSATKSLSRNPTDKKLEYAWIISGPAKSAYELIGVHGDNVKFQPDMAGAYSVMLVAQDAASYCDFAEISFGVTANETFLGTNTPRQFDTTKDAALFHHLDEVGAQVAWKKNKGAGVIIAVLDTGVNYNHPDLRANVLVNAKEIAGNGIDDDKNGVVDDVIGWDFFGNDNMPFDDNRHGTHVAGIAASAVTGVAPHAKIIPVKVLGPLGGGDLASILGGIYYAADRGAHIANMSLGMDSFGMSLEERTTVHKAFRDAADYARKKGMLIVAAAGNGDPLTGIGYDVDKTPHYPSSVNLSNIVAVSSVDSNGKLTSYSNFGKSVHLAAPGGSFGDPDNNIPAKPIMAAFYYPNKQTYVGLAGTSMAAPVVSGALALLRGIDMKATPDSAVKAMLQTVSFKQELNGKIKTGGVLKVDTAITTLGVQPAPLLSFLGL